MRYIVSGKEMKHLDNNTSSCFKVPVVVLMEQAAKEFVHELLALNISGKGIVFCGNGNNGADGLAVARLLIEQGLDIDICIVKDVWKLDAKVSDLFLVQKDICDAYQYSMVVDKEQIIQTKYDFVVDAVFGIGLTRTLSEEYLEILSTINQIDATHIAVDMPSGVNADNGQVMGSAVKCDYTITFSYNKLGLELWPGSDYAGCVVVADMGITDHSWMEKKPSFAYLTQSDLLKISKRPSHSNKGTFGKLLIIAGGDNMAGAAILSARAAYRNGVGLVKIYTSNSNRVAIQIAVPEAIVVTYEEKVDYIEFGKEVQWADAVVVGPGLGTTDCSKEIVEFIAQNSRVPVLFDADALNIIAQNTNILLKNHTDWVVTPHLGEFSRLTGQDISWIQNNLTETALEFARTYDVICVLKDFHTITANPYGLSFLNLSGNNGMATAGSGDVLSGVIGAFLAQGIKCIEAAAYGVFIHGMAGDWAERIMGTHPMMASDIVDGLKEVWNKVENNNYAK